MESKLQIASFEEWVNNKFQNLWWNVFDESDRIECEQDGTYDYGYEPEFGDNLYEFQVVTHSLPKTNIMLPEEVVELGGDIEGNIQYTLVNLIQALIGYCPSREGENSDHLIVSRRGGNSVEVYNPSTYTVENCELDWETSILNRDTKEVVATLHISILDLTTSDTRDLEDVYNYLVGRIRYL